MTGDVQAGQRVPAPQSLDELHDLPTEDFHKVDRYQWGDSATPGKVIDHIIELAEQELTWRGRENANTLRDFWYNPTKPIIERVFPDSDTDHAATLSKRLSDAVEVGEVTYRDLNIVDDSRKRNLYTTSPESDRILFVEKRAAYQKLTPLAEVYELSLVSGGGQAATAMIEDLIRQVHKEVPTGGKFEFRKDGFEIFLLTDYDPAGFQIGESFVERCQTLGLPISSVERIGVSPDHLSNEELRRQRFEPPARSDKDREWLAEFGIEGTFGLEIEAVGDRNRKGEALREIVVDALAGRIRVNERIERDLKEAREQIPLDAAGQVADEIIADLSARLQDEAADIIERRTDISPDSYTPDELHNGAVSGRAPSVDTYAARKQLKAELQERVADGRISVSELLRDNGGGGA